MDVDIAVLGGGPGGYTAAIRAAQLGADRRRQMNETCDRCGPAVLALYRVIGRGELCLCGHCTRELWPALFAQGWTIWPAGEQALITDLSLVPAEGWPHGIRRESPRRRPALLHFLASKLTRGKSQRGWPSDAITRPQRTRREK